MTYLFIMVAKIVEVSLATVRMVLITKGERKIGSFIAFFEVSIWIIVVSSVLDNITADPFKIIAYALGFSIGNYLGSVIEERIGIGHSEMNIIVKEEDGAELAKVLRDEGYAVTILSGQGKNHPRNILILYVPRTKLKSCVELVKSNQENAVITISDKKPVYGGFGTLRK